MAWWHWVAGGTEAFLLAVIALLWHDTLRERRGWRLRDHPGIIAASAISVPVGFVIALLSPGWLAIALIAIPAIAIAVMALAS